MSFAPSQSLSSRAQDTVLGLFVVVAIVLGGWLFFEDTRQAQGKQLTFEAVLSSSYGLSKGSPVRLNGVNVGRIESIGLTAQGDVALTLSMQTEYQSLYREGSQLKIDSTLDIDNVLSGAGIAFIPGTGAPLGNGATLTASEPKSLKTLMEEWDIQALSQKVADILINLDAIVSNVSNNQDSLTRSLENVATLTESMNDASQQLPAVLAQMQQTMKVMESTLQNGQTTLTDNMGAFTDVAEQSSALIKSIDKIASNIEPTVSELPETQALLNNLLFEVNGLTQQLRQHWLLQGGQAASDKSGKRPQGNGLFPPDESLYPSERGESQGEPES